MSFIINHIETLTTIVLGLNVFLCACNNKWNWPIGLVGVTMYGLSSWFLWGLYADAILQIFYFVTGIVGWIYWVRGGTNKTEAPVIDLYVYQGIYLLLFIVIGTTGLSFFLDANTDSTVPVLDAYTTVMSLAAQVLMIYKARQAWIIWIFTNFAYIVMFAMKDLDQLALLYIAFLFNAVFGYIKWSKDMK